MSLARKNDQSKPDFTLIPPEAELEVVRAFQEGANKYGRDNWRGLAHRRLLAAAMRHINARRRGVIYDTKSDVHHLAHAAASLMMIVQLEQEGWKYGEGLSKSNNQNNAESRNDGDPPHGQVEARGPGFELLGEEP